MKLLLVSVLLIVAFHHGTGAPRTARYNYVKCNPDGDQANCVTYQTLETAWSPDLPTKLPALAVEYLEAEAVEGESRMKVNDMVEDGSGDGSGILSSETLAFVTVDPEIGSGGEVQYGALEAPVEEELKEDHLLQL